MIRNLRFKSIYKNNKKFIFFFFILAGLTTIIHQFEFHLLEAKLYDFRITTGLTPQPSNELAIIVIDEKTVRELNEFAPLTMDLHAQFLSSLAQYQPKSIGYLISMNQVAQNDPEIFESIWSKKFTSTAEMLIKNNTPFLFGTSFDLTGEILPPYPLSTLPHAVALIHEDGNTFAQDNVSRKAVISIHDKPTFHLKLAQESGFLSDQHLPSGSHTEDKVDAQFLHFRYHDNPNSFNIYSFIDVLTGRVSPEKIKSKVVLVGSLIKENPQDFAKTPLSKSYFSYPKILIHTNITETIIQDNGIHKPPFFIEWMFTFFAISLVFFFALKYSPSIGLAATIATTVTILILGYFLFFGIPGLISGYWIPLSTPLIGLLISYYIVVPFRLLKEYKKRWDFQRQNKILVEVEELKSNFLSLVTHDLKTPVAKIQGLTEVLINQLQSKISPAENKTLGHILQSTDDLNHFINKILELAKIESNKITLKLESKDLNQIIEKSVEHLKHNAKLKNITLKTQLEPLFPVKVDAILMLKIINNLIDNAIKYSPENSEILISSQDYNDMIRITVKDQGIGINETDKKGLFTKFYRVKNKNTSEIKGTGLGLYLTKYFIDAHKGEILVDSEDGEGTSFSILIPQNLDEIILKNKKTRPHEGEGHYV